MFKPDRLYPTSAPELRVLASRAMMSQWRHFGRGPSYIKMEGRVFYRGRDLIEYLEENTVRPVQRDVGPIERRQRSAA